jgi:hypothetical protein
VRDSPALATTAADACDCQTNLAKHNITQLTALVKTRLKRMQYWPGLLEGFLASTGLDLTPFCNPHH